MGEIGEERGDIKPNSYHKRIFQYLMTHKKGTIVEIMKKYGVSEGTKGRWYQARNELINENQVRYLGGSKEFEIANPLLQIPILQAILKNNEELLDDMLSNKKYSCMEWLEKYFGLIKCFTNPALLKDRRIKKDILPHIKKVMK